MEYRSTVTPLAEKITSKSLRTLAKFGLDATGEGAEEVVSQFISNLGSSLYREENLAEILFSEEALDSYIESFIGGLMMGGTSSGFKIVQSAQEGIDYTTGLTENEQKVVDAEVKNRIEAKEEQDGKELTNKERYAIRDEVMKDLDRGNISIDTIESVLGGETYEAYKSSTDKINSLETEMATLQEQLKDVRPAVKERAQKRLSEVQAELSELTNNSANANLKAQLSSEVQELTKNERLYESYNEVARRSQAFEADLTQYDAKTQETVKKAIESGILNNTRKTHDFVDLIAKLSAEKGVSFDFTNNENLKNSGFAIEGKTVNGLVQGNEVILNIDSAKALNTVVGHEITHVLEGTELYSELQQVMKSYAEMKGEYESRLKALKETYKDIKDANIENELTADLVGDYLFTDSDFINSLSTESPSIFKKIFDEIKYLYKSATAGSEEQKKLLEVKRAFEKAYRESGKATTDSDATKYSIVEAFVDNNGTQFKNAVLLDTNYFGVSSPRNWGRALKEHIEQRSAENTFIMPVVDENGDVQNLEFARKNDYVSKNGGKQHSVLGKLYTTSDNVSKLSAIHIDEIVEVSEEDIPYYTSGNNHGWLDKNGWLHRTANVINNKNGNIYQIELDIAKTEDGRTILYALNGKTKKVGNADVNSLIKRGSSLNSNFNDSVTQNSENASAKYSLEDSDGRKLTKEQQEYFKDSQVRDDSGNLLVVYHGTRNADFTVFNRNHTYFTDSKEMADSYAPTSEMYSGYLKMAKPFVVDAKGDKWSGIAIDDETAQMLRESGSSVFKERGAWRTTPADIVSAIEEGVDEGIFDYDGVIIKNVDDTGSYGGENNVVANDYIVFNSNQFKNIDNTNPTDNPDIRFSLSDTVEETKNLVAVHNMRGTELLKTLDLGGFPMPSIAITKDDYSHNEYGEISVLFGKETIDPQFMRSNKVYGGDAWTPVYPNIEYEADPNISRKVARKFYDYSDKIPEGFRRTSQMLAYELEDMLNREGGEIGLMEMLKNDVDMKQLYLAETGTPIEKIIKTTTTEMTEAEKEMAQYFLDNASELVEEYGKQGISAIPWARNHANEIEQAYRKYLKNALDIDDAGIDNVIENTRLGDMTKLIREANRYKETGGITKNDRAKMEYRSTYTTAQLSEIVVTYNMQFEAVWE